MDHQVDAVVCGVGSGGTLTGLGRFFKRVSPKTKMVLADPVGSVLAELVKTGNMMEAGSWMVEGIGEDFVPPIADLSLVNEGLHDHRRRELRHRPRAADEGRHPRRLLLRHAARGGAALLPRADDGQARRQLRLRQRQQISVEDVQRLSGCWTRASRARAARRSARPDRRGAIPTRATVIGRSGGHAAHRLCAHAAVRRLAAAGAGRAARSSASSTKSDILLQGLWR